VASLSERLDPGRRRRPSVLSRRVVVDSASDSRRQSASSAPEQHVGSHRAHLRRVAAQLEDGFGSAERVDERELGCLRRGGRCHR
jgi:hypothetical protein